ncbi:putative protein phosphatase 2C 60 [Senna tora]|uniref:protein-serine/threonine phosphatase n=1 Tax=Senna tora TaxID=362788 RepID=A0A834U1M8_9FABA|nr:putative protein phosphatase 2C 60 [Senna tora]
MSSSIKRFFGIPSQPICRYEKTYEDGENEYLRYGLSSMQGWRENMEDSHVAFPRFDGATSFFGVYDGHGGKEVAKFCAKYFHQVLLNSEDYRNGDIETSLRETFFRMDEMMSGQRGWRELAMFGGKLKKLSATIQKWIWSSRRNRDNWATEKGLHSGFSGPQGTGSTSCVAVIRHNLVVVANAGDSRAVLSRGAQALDLSIDHKPTLQSEIDRIERAKGSIKDGRVNGKIAITRAIGDMYYKEAALPREDRILTANPDVRTVHLTNEDEFLVIACDGLWDCMTSQEMVNCVRRHYFLVPEGHRPPLSRVCAGAINECCPRERPRDGKGGDNMTMILVLFRQPQLNIASTSGSGSTS